MHERRAPKGSCYRMLESSGNLVTGRMGLVPHKTPETLVVIGPNYSRGFWKITSCKWCFEDGVALWGRGRHGQNSISFRILVFCLKIVWLNHPDYFIHVENGDRNGDTEGHTEGHRCAHTKSYIRELYGIARYGKKESPQTMSWPWTDHDMFLVVWRFKDWTSLR